MPDIFYISFVIVDEAKIRENRRHDLLGDLKLKLDMHASVAEHRVHRSSCRC